MQLHHTCPWWRRTHDSDFADEQYLESIHWRDLSEESMSVPYYAVQFDTTGFDQETWMALLSEWPFDSFHQDGDVLIGYIQQGHWHPDLLDFIENEKGNWYNSFEYGLVPDRNWNEEWESSFHPVEVDD